MLVPEVVKNLNIAVLTSNTIFLFGANVLIIKVKKYKEDTGLF
jgi:hypothetical protein